ncbi:MAG: hypothetical protein AB8G11_06690 [Saprospiraceae bacterium]
MQRLLIVIFLSSLIWSCNKGEQNANSQQSPTTTIETPTYSTTEYPVVDVYQNTNGVPIYNGFIDMDTLEMSSGNKYIMNTMAYNVWNKFLYLDNNYEVVITDKPDEVSKMNLGKFHPYILRISVMKKPVNLQNVQTVVVGISDNGVSNVHRTDFLQARLEGWDMQLSTKQNFPSCTTDDLECKAKQITASVVNSMFR